MITVAIVVTALLAAQVTAAPPPLAAAAQPAAQQISLPAGTVLSIETLDPVFSKHAHTGDHFRIRLAAPLAINGTIVIMAGVTGIGEVIHAKSVRFGGSPGELILAARSLDVGGVQVPLRGFRISGSGASSTSFIYTGYSVGMVQNGSNVSVPAGTRADAKVAVDTNIAVAANPPIQETNQ